MSLAEACRNAVHEQIAKVGSGDSSLAQVCQDAILKGLQPLIEEIGMLSTMIAGLKEGLGGFRENGEKGVLTGALTKLVQLEGEIRGIEKSPIHSFEEEGSFAKDKGAFMSRKVIDDEIRRCRDSLIVTFDAEASKVGNKITPDLVKALNVEKKRLPADLKNLTDEEGQIKSFSAKDLSWSRLRSPRLGRNANKAVFRLRLSGQYGKRCLFQVLKQGGDKFAGLQVKPEIPSYLREAMKISESLAFFIRKQKPGTRTKCSFHGRKNGIEVLIGRKSEGASSVKYTKVAASFEEDGCILLEDEMTEAQLRDLAVRCIEKMNNPDNE